MYALNLTRSPENIRYWERADPIIMGAGETVSAGETSANRRPGVSDSIEPHNGRGLTRRATNKELLGKRTAKEVPEYHGRCKKRTWDGRVASDGDRRAATA